MNAHSHRDRKSGDAQVAGPSRSPLLRLPMRRNFLGQEKTTELLMPAASDRAWSGAIAKNQRRRLDEERLAGFNHSADPSTYRRKISVRTTRATAHCSHDDSGLERQSIGRCGVDRGGRRGSVCCDGNDSERRLRNIGASVAGPWGDHCVSHLLRPVDGARKSQSQWDLWEVD
jgi:hypothetical protein